MSVICMLIVVVSAGEAPSVSTWTAEYERVSRRYMVQEAAQLVSTLRGVAAGNNTPEQRMLLAKALLLLADWNRLAYEKLAPEATEQRRALGREIDSAAQEGLELLSSLEESAEVSRLKADFYGAMIRTSHQAKKYLESMDEALKKALELDSDQPEAQVSLARRYLFADESHGGDIGRAKDILDKILDQKHDYEQALLLRGLAYLKLGFPQKAVEDWQHALKNNPDCRPAREELAERGKLPSL